jgi:hypothetical protein
MLFEMMTQMLWPAFQAKILSGFRKTAVGHFSLVERRVIVFSAIDFCNMGPTSRAGALLSHDKCHE